MKRAHLLLGIFTAMLVVWLWLADRIESKTNWLAIPVLIAGVFGGYSAFTILKSVLSLKDYPEDEKSLREDIRRAQSFYAEKNIKL